MKKILIVDDQPAVRELVSVTLEIGPYKILTAENGDQALALARTEMPDLILLDVQMPGGSLDGLDVCRTLKKDARTRQIHIVMLTAKGQDWDKQAGREAGADDYFVKPFSPLELMNKVEAVLS
ncbi:MAG: response regulator [Anaerolineae bacterium]|nr:response regulator [Anaerolineae bacterium]